MTTTKKTTRTIAGHAFTLTPGLRYFASRPIAQRGMTRFDVTVRELTGDGLGLRSGGVAVVRGLTYDQANRLLAAFNNGKISFEGRLWK